MHAALAYQHRRLRDAHRARRRVGQVFTLREVGLTVAR